MNTFEWLNFLIGGAIGSFFGALIILKIERVSLASEEKRKKEEELEAASQSLRIESVLNYRYCYIQIKRIKEDPKTPQGFIPFKKFWLNIFLSKYIDITNERGLRLLMLINNINSDIESINYRCRFLNSELKLLVESGLIKKLNEKLISDLESLMKGIFTLETQRILNEYISEKEAADTGTKKIIQELFYGTINSYEKRDI